MIVSIDWDRGSDFKDKARQSFAHEDYLSTVKVLEEYLDRYLDEVEGLFTKEREVITSLIVSSISPSNLKQLRLSSKRRDLVFQSFCQEYLNAYLSSLEGYLRDKVDILDMLMVSYYNLIKEGVYDLNKVGSFEIYRSEYFEIARWFKEEGKLKSWSEAKLENLIRYNIEIIFKKFTEVRCQSLKQMEVQIKGKLRGLLSSFLSTFTPTFSEYLFIKQVLVNIYDERQNFRRKGWDRYQNIRNTEWLIDIFLEFTQGNEEYRDVRGDLMNLMADITYFFSENQGDRGRRERRAIKWLERSLEEFSDNRFTESRIKELRRNITTRDQINKFRHDTINKIHFLRENLSLLLAEGRSQEEMKTDIKKLIQEVEDIDLLFRVTKRESPKFEVFSPEEIIKEIEANLPSKPKLSLTFKGEEREIEGDRGYFKIILENLIENSLEAYKRIGVGPEASQVIVEVDPQSMEWKVIDNAGGIPEEFQEGNKLFEPYISSKGVCQDVGLGLAQVSAAVEVQGGEIDYSSDSKGTEFRIKIPLEEY
ncbi:sensor histidine kinase [Halonatronum saccharophilum]|uniref:sensor histidine kinase n=1 Tax=Halonatronum saccharophilum TaxID=150060 RepID=UPI0004892241|nr:HAMP domain-containing sensor histidine kinase [Halonatronum saccharophilum]